SALSAKSLSSPPHPPSPPTPLRISAPPGPILSKQRCSRSTRVEPSACGVNCTSTSLDFARSGSKPHSCVICHANTKRRGGSHVVICPHGQLVPSACSPYIRPPSNGSMTARVMGDLPMWCVRGHQLSKPSVKTRKACSAL